MQIVFFSSITEGFEAPALSGRYTIASALQIILAGSNLTFQVINPKTIQVRPLSATERENEESRRTGKEDMPAVRRDNTNAKQSKKAVDNLASLEEIVVNGTAEGLVATRIETPLREIPQTLSITSQEQMRQQNDTDLADLLNNAVGITVVQNNSLDKSFISRGFTITTFHVDGGAALNSFSNTPIFGTPDLGEFDRVEVLRGSDALYGGVGNPGATVNMIRKRPLADSEVTFSAAAGSWNNYRSEVDATGALAFDGALRARVDVVYGDRDYFFAPASLERRKIFGVLEADLTTRTLLTVGGSYQWDNALPFIGGLPAYTDGADAHLPRTIALAFDWSRYDTQTRELYAQLQQSFGSAWRLKLNATSLDTAAEFAYGIFGSQIDPLTKSLPVLPSALFSASPNTQDQFVVDGTLTGSFELFTRRVDVAMGADYTHFKGDIAIEGVNALEPAVSNVFDFNPAAYPTAPTPAVPDRSAATTNQSGEFASARVYLTDELSLVAGARMSSNRLSNAVLLNFAGVNLSVSEETRDKNKVTPFVGVTYDVSPHYSLYASYADIYQTNSGQRRIAGALLPPADGVDQELGIKGSWRDSALNGLLVLYDIEQKGLAVFDANASNAEQQSTPDCCYLPLGTNKSKGLDAELNGAMNPGWFIGAGYTFNINQNLAGGDLSSATPRHLIKLWSSIQLPAGLRRWTLGGSFQAQSSNYASGFICSETNPFGICTAPARNIREVQGPFIVMGLRTGYKINEHWRAALSINNVLDRSYYQTIGIPTGGNWYGEPRGFAVRIDGRY